MEREKRNTKIIGDLSELMAIDVFIEAGYFIARPFGENSRYDLVVERDRRLTRVQVKTGRLRKGVISFNPWSMHSNRGLISCQSYKGQIDAFAVFCGATSSVYLVPVDDVGTSGSLRIERRETVSRGESAGPSRTCWGRSALRNWSL